MTITYSPMLDVPVADPPEFADITLPRTTWSVSEARAWLAYILTDWDVPAATVEDSVQILSEVATNAIIHNAGTDDITVTAAWWHGHLRVTVSDPDLRVPVLDLAADEHGRGLVIVTCLATRWGTCKTRNGKITWFECTSEVTL